MKRKNIAVVKFDVEGIKTDNYYFLQKPQLVLFKDEEEYTYTYGILFNNNILCFDCGGLY